jgi:hypothetical protein
MFPGGSANNIYPVPPNIKHFSQRLPVDWNEQRKFLGLPEKDYAAK